MECEIMVNDIITIASDKETTYTNTNITRGNNHNNKLNKLNKPNNPNKLNDKNNNKKITKKFPSYLYDPKHHNLKIVRKHWKVV